ncbi:MAG: arsenite methyltransferase [Nitrososphaera sp.]
MVKKQEIKNTIRKNYGKIALQETTKGSPCCGPDCCSGESPAQSAEVVGYNPKDLKAIPQASILGVGCGAPLNFAGIQKGEIVLDLGSGAGIDAFLSANIVGKSGKVIGVDMTEEMLARARRNAREAGYSNVEFKKGDIEERIPVGNNSVDVVISNCVINLTTDKVKAFKEVKRILKPGGRMVISDLVADKSLPKESISLEQWSGCIDGALPKEEYIDSIRKAGFRNIQVVNEQLYMQGEKVNGRKISSVVVRAVKE